jgi:hypothetical protein
MLDTIQTSNIVGAAMSECQTTPISDLHASDIVVNIGCIQVIGVPDIEAGTLKIGVYHRCQLRNCTPILEYIRILVVRSWDLSFRSPAGDAVALSDCLLAWLTLSNHSSRGCQENVAWSSWTDSHGDYNELRKASPVCPRAERSEDEMARGPSSRI